MGDQLYDQKVKQYAANKEVEAAVRLCETCGQLQFCHKSGPCTRSEKDNTAKYKSEEIIDIAAAINKDIVNQIIENAKKAFAKDNEVSNISESDPNKNNDKLAEVLDKIASVLSQQRQGSSQLTKVKPPPTWAAESFADYKAEVDAWEQAHPGEDFVKYSEFLNELKRNKLKAGLSEYVSTIVIDKTRSNKNVQSVLEALREKYDLSKKEKFVNIINMLKSFKPCKSESGEAVFTKIEKIVAEFAVLDIGNNINYYLVTLLLNELYGNDILNEIEKRNFEDLIEGKNDASIITEFKKWFKKVHIEGKREKSGPAVSTEESKTFFVRRNSSNERSRYGAWKNSRDFRDYSRTNSNNWRTKSGNRWRKSESNSRQSTSQSRRSDSGVRSFKDIGQALSQVLSQLKSLDEKQEKMAKIIDEKVINAKFVETDFVEVDWSNEKANIFFTKDIDNPNEMVVDCGAPKSLIGEKCLSEYLKSNYCDKNDIERFRCKQKFKFGPSHIYLSTEKVNIPIMLEDKNIFAKQYVEAYVIQADVPFLLGLNTMKNWRVLMDMEKDEMIFREIDKNVKMIRNDGGHLTVPLQKLHEWSTTETVLFMKSEDDICSFEKIRKVHVNTNHKSEPNMLHAYKQANHLTDGVRRLIKKVCESCTVCQKMQKSQCKPKVALPKVTDFNQVVTMDLKLFGDRYVLWLVDSFTRFIQGYVIKNKQAETVVEAVQSVWCLRFGYPSRGFWADNGNEFQNKDMSEYMSKLGLKIEFGPTYSPWSNGINERNHYSADIIVKKAQETDKTLSLQKAVDLASWTHNTNINLHGYEPMRLVTGKSVNIPGVTTGNEATDSLYDSEAVQRIMERHQEFIQKFREQEYSNKLKRAATSRSNVMNNFFYNEGDEVFFQEKDRKSWIGPVKVFCQKGREIYLFSNGNIRKVPSCKVKPFKTVSSFVDINNDEKSSESNMDKTDRRISFEDDSNENKSFDLNKNKSLNFDDSKSLNSDLQKDTVGTYWMKVENSECSDELTTYVVEVPVHQHNRQDVKMAKEVELKNLMDYETFEEVADVGQERITSRWVVTTKEVHDGQKTKCKARLVARGFQEEVSPQSDSPTVLRESNKLFTAVAANAGFNIVSIDIRAAFLQSKELKRDVFVVPPKDISKVGIIWRLKKPLYGLNDASRRFWLRLKELFKNEGLLTLPGDEAFYYKNIDGDLMGMIITHVDDLQIAGNNIFINLILEKLTKTLTVSKVEKNSFRFTGIDVKKVSDGIEISMEDYSNSIEEVMEIRKVKKDEPLTKVEMKLFRKYVGKLNWLAENTRPDLAIWALNLSKQNAKATVGDLKRVNQIVKKVRNRQSKVQFTRIGHKEDLVVHAIGDASYKSDGPSIGGSLIMLGSRNCTKVNPLFWKSKQIRNVCHSAKDAETRNIMTVVDTAVYMSQQLSVLLFGIGGKQIPVKIYTDLKPLLDSIASSKQVEQKLLRNTMTDLKMKLENRCVDNYSWVETKAMTADILTKEGGNIENILEVVCGNIFKKANEDQNVVLFQDGEMIVQNPLLRKDTFDQTGN